MRISAPSSSVQSTRSGLSTTMSPTVWMSPAVTCAGSLLLHHHALGAFALHLDGDVLDVEDDVGDVLAHARDRRELVQHAVDMDGRHGGALQRRQQNAPQRIAERQAEAALERLGDHGRLPLGVGAGRHLQLVRSDQFLPVLLDRHVGTHRVEWRGIGPRVPFRPVGNFVRSRRVGRPLDEHIIVHTRRLLRGRQPLCGIGVTSRIEVTVKPAACNARNAELAARTGAGDFDFERTHAVFLRLLGGVFGRDLSRIGRRLARALETHRAGRRPGNGVALRVGDGDHGIVERLHSHARRRTRCSCVRAGGRGWLPCPFSVLSRPAARAGPITTLYRRSLSSTAAYFFLPAIGFAGPLRVRALVCVRWPRTGRPRRWRSPR